MPELIVMEPDMYVYFATCGHFNGALYISLPSLIPPLQPYKFLRQYLNNCNVTRMPEPIVRELGMYIMPPEAISTAYFINSFHQ
jgi:hypothetical protein